MRGISILFGAAVIICDIFHTARPQRAELSIAAYNVARFGPTKAANPTILEVITDIVHRYDIILLEGIESKDGTAIDALMDRVNLRENSSRYNLEMSERLGNSGRQFAFLWRNESGIDLRDTHQYNSSSSIFNIPPFSVLFYVNYTDQHCKTSGSEFALMAVQSISGGVEEEAIALPDVHQEVSKLWKTNDILIMGDLKAACHHLSKRKLNNLPLRKDPRFRWLIPDSVTTALSQQCAFDRFIISGSDFIKSVVPGSPTVFHFDEAYNLSKEFAERVSMRYPIELEVTCKTDGEESPATSGAATSSLPATVIATAAMSLVLCLLLPTRFDGRTRRLVCCQ